MCSYSRSRTSGTRTSNGCAGTRMRIGRTHRSSRSSQSASSSQSCSCPAEVHFPSGAKRHIASYGIWYDRLVVDATHILATCTEADIAGEKTRQRISRLPGGKE
eukprot:PhM_4_TR18847/c3_g1_i6/m.100381